MMRCLLSTTLTQNHVVFMDPHFENLGNKIKIISNFNSINCNLNKIIYEMTLTEKERSFEF